MNLDKMRRNLARNVPDAVWKDFDRMDFDVHTTPAFIEWRDWFCRMMKLKYGDKPMLISFFIADRMDYNAIRVQMVSRPRPMFSPILHTQGEIKETMGFAPKEKAEVSVW